MLTPYAFTPPSRIVFEVAVVPSTTFVTAKVPSELPRPPVPTQTSVEYRTGNQLAYDSDGKVAHVYPEGQHVARVSMSVPAEDVAQHACEYPDGQTPGEKYCDVDAHPEGRHLVASGGPRWRKYSPDSPAFDSTGKYL